MIRLRNIDPAALATEVHANMVQCLARVAMWCGVELGYRCAVRTTSVWRDVYATAHYALNGRRVDGIDLDDALFGSQVYERHIGSKRLAEPETGLQVVIAAALARCLLERDEPINASQLAVLASVSRSRIAQLQRSGGAPRGRKSGRTRADRLVSADAARAWLAERGVQGVAA